MKKITFVALLLTCFNAVAQNYTFLKTTATYSDLANPISLSNGEVWDDPEYEITLPFSFTINNVATNSLLVYDSYISFDTDDELAHIASPIGNDLIDRGDGTDVSLSPISYRIDGNPGNRIVKIEFKNCGSFDDFSLSMFVNFQIWLYETTNVIEYRYGASSVTSPEDFYSGETGGIAAVVILDDLFEEVFSEDSVFLEGSPSNPTTTNQLAFLNGTPSNGTVYRFTPATLSNDNFNLNDFTIYPNPTNNVLNIAIQTLGLNYSIQDMTGKTVQNGILNQQVIDVNGLQKGMYLINIEEYKSQKFIKN